MIKKVAIVGTQGVPANYGGFESLVENIIGENCPDGVQYTVFCSSRDLPDRRSSYKGATLKYIPLHANGAQSIPYDILSMCRCMRGYDAVLVLGVSGCLFLPVLKAFGRSRIIVNIDGLEHRRAKWGPVARRVLRMSEAVAVRAAHVVIADNKGIQDYVAQTYARPAALVAYGGDHAMRSISEDFAAATLARYGLRKDGYAITVCRIEPENNSDIILEAFSRMPERQLVFIGNWNHSEWARRLLSICTATAPAAPIPRWWRPCVCRARSWHSMWCTTARPPKAVRHISRMPTALWRRCRGRCRMAV